MWKVEQDEILEPFLRLYDKDGPTQIRIEWGYIDRKYFPKELIKELDQAYEVWYNKPF